VEAELGKADPIGEAWMPTRCNAELALGDTYCTWDRASSTITPSPTRGAALESPTRCGNGNEPAAIIETKFSNTAPYERSS
jgi:hypothetical protein